MPGLVFVDALKAVVVELTKIEAERKLVAGWRLRQDELVGKRSHELGCFRCSSGDARGEPCLWRDGDLGASRGYCREDPVSSVLNRGSYDGCGGTEGEPAGLLSLITDVGGVDVASGPHQPWADCGDAYAFVAEFGVQALGEADQGEFTGDVGQKVWDGDFTSDGGDVDDGGGAIVRDTEHVRKHSLRGVESSEEVGGHGATVGGEGLVLDRADLDDAGVVDQDIDAAEVGDGVVDEVFGLSGIGEIGGDEEDSFRGADGATVEQGIAGGDEFIDVAGREDETTASASKAFGQAEAEATGAASDKYHIISVKTA